MSYPPSIQVLYIEGCPHWVEALRLARAAAREAGAAEVDVVVTEVRTGEQAARLGFGGSPTILVGGKDPFPGSRIRGLGCRVYQTSRGLAGVPEHGMLVAAIRSAVAA